MSLVVGVKTYHGIVISADRRASVEYEENGIVKFSVITDNEQKLFVTKSGVAIAYTGNSCIPPISAIINKVCQEYSANSQINDVVEDMKRLTESNTANIIVCGYEYGTPRLISIHKGFEEDLSSSQIMYSGKKEIVKAMLKFPTNTNFFNLQDAIDYTQFLIYTTAKIQSFSEMNQSVSEKCDTLVITDSGHKWIEKNQLHSHS